ncbi:DUF6011 domain-containing protein [Pseudofrankia sp. BMG5.37]|uniref:DUF6011 domain-containing protein n=1 Tax=Pseudofrankia sp. BMG5.37 TaxID=3050035 RepID=UPI002894F4AB|nr:DUF6011 domain-containing protein [Pseudofrankia sp. BMG5.37]MDT3438322.1 DUF6011 domain-containing protein [Pseudofrankia sp. BMG5.37]
MTTTTTATRDLFDIVGAFGDETDAMAERFAAVVAGVALEAAPAVTETPAEPVPAAEVRCLGGCGRVLRSAASIARGYGRRCWERAHRRAETLAGSFSDDQVEAAVEAIEDGAVIPAAEAHVWLVVSSRGDEVYRVENAAVCDCEAGQAGRQCWHLGAVALVAT